jgi:hypothetical protein
MRIPMIGGWGGKLAISAGLALGFSHAAADPVSYKTKNSEILFVDGKPRRILIHTISAPQKDIGILGRSFIDSECHVIGLANYNVITPPVNGSVCYREESQAVTVQPFGNRDGHCLGTPALTRVVYYRPSGAYLGQDGFQYALMDAKRQPISIADVDVTLTKLRGPSRQPAAATPPESATIQQKPGPMPRCADPVS